MALILTEASFFTEKLNSAYPGLEGIDRTYLKEGAEAARARFAAFIRAGALDTARFYAERENTVTEKELERGERIVDGWLSSTGVPMHFPARQVDWFANPTYNGYREWTWQLSRHPEWSLLAKLYRAKPDEKYAEAFRDYFLTWSEQTEMPMIGVSGFATLAWRTLEAGIRLLGSWNEAIFAFFASPSLSDDFITRFFRSLWENAYRVRFVNTSHNWLVTEMSGLAAFGVLYPFFREAREWDDYAMMRLTTELDRQVYPDHFQFEMSTGYHRCVISSYIGAIRMHRKMQVPLPEEMERKMPEMYLMFIQLMTPDGTTPDLNDGGRVNIAGQCREAMEFFPWLKDPFTYFATNGKEGDPPAYTSIAMEYSGHTVMRTGWEKEDLYAMLENAPFGFAHQHEDKLEVLLSAYGKRMLDDRGNFRYDSSAMRRYVLSTYSHNTATVDGMGQNRRKTYKWHPEDIGKKAGTRFQFTEDYEIAVGCYDSGYGEDLLSVRHERTLLFLKHGIAGVSLPLYIVYDSFRPADGAEHTYRLLWHLEDVTAVRCGNRIDSDYGDGVSLTIVASHAPEIVKGQYEPLYLGWHPDHTPGDHEHIPTPTVVIPARGASLSMATLLIPAKEMLPPELTVSCDAIGNVTVICGDASETVNLPALL